MRKRQLGARLCRSTAPGAKGGGLQAPGGPAGMLAAVVAVAPDHGADRVVWIRAGLRLAPLQLGEQALLKCRLQIGCFVDGHVQHPAITWASTVGQPARCAAFMARLTRLLTTSG
jgi:hypothetical protein